MKYLIVLSILILTGCTDSGNAAYDAVVALQKETQLNLQSCQASLDTYREQAQPVIVEPTKPEIVCEETEYTMIYKDGKLLASCTETEETSCGVHASGCQDGFEYNCLTNIKTGSETKKSCHKE